MSDKNDSPATPTTDSMGTSAAIPPAARRPMIEAVGLSKFYGPFAAARDVTFSVGEGELVAFLGPNGAGKSTTMKMLDRVHRRQRGDGPHRRSQHDGRSHRRFTDDWDTCPKTDRCIPK